MNKILISIVLFIVSSNANSATIYLDETEYLNALAALGYNTVYESFEDDTAWSASRSMSSVASTTSQGIIWKSNSFNSSTVNNGDAANGSYIFYSNPHGDTTDTTGECEVADEGVWDDLCWMYDGWIVDSADGETLYGIGGQFTSTGSGAKVTFLLDGVNVNEARDGDVVGLDWTFIGVIDEAGFSTVEILELRGKDSDGALIWGDSFTVATSAVPLPAAAWLFISGLIGFAGIARKNKAA